MNLQMSVVKNSKRWITLSLILIIISLASMIAKGFNYGIDFSGGSLLQLKYERPVTLKELNPVLDEISKKIPQFNSNSRKVQVSEDNSVIIRTQEITNEQKEIVLTELKKSGEFTLTREDKVGASVGAELKRSALLALGIGTVLIILYITMRFEFRFAMASIIAILHDIIIAMGGISLLSYEVDTPFIAAILTILGYSINNTIVVFDRIRETLKRKTDLTFSELLDKSINQVIIRSVNTSVTTLLAIIAILIFGGDSLKTFITTLLIGIVVGTYSSIFIAPSLIYLFEKDRDGKINNSKYLKTEDDDEHHEKIVV